MISDKSIVITGGAGFVGNALCTMLSESNKVISIDNYFTGTAQNHFGGVKYLEGCASDIGDLVKSKVDYVFHLGEYSRVEQSFDDWEFCLENNSMPIIKVLDFCVKNRAKLIYSGSSTKFTTDPDGASQSPYAFSKARNVELVKAFSNWFGLEYAITYFYNVFGPNEINAGKYATVVGKFLQQKAASEPLTVTLPGTQKRNFTHIDDIAAGISLVACYGQGDDFGIGNTQSYTIIELANMVSENVIFTNAKSGNRADARLNCSKTIGLGWKPKVSLSSYIKDRIQSL